MSDKKESLRELGQRLCEEANKNADLVIILLEGEGEKILSTNSRDPIQLARAASEVSSTALRRLEQKLYEG